MPETGFAIWVVGLPGSGKSTLAKAVHARLLEHGHDAVLLQMDARRKAYFPNPTYSAEEREQAYAMFIDEAATLVEQGRAVVMDGTAYRAAMRREARKCIARFAEILVRCDVREAMRREASRPKGLVMAGLYRKALERQETGKQFDGLGDVVGVDVPFEEDSGAEFMIDNTTLSKAETRAAVVAFLDSWLKNA